MPAKKQPTQTNTDPVKKTRATKSKKENVNMANENSLSSSENKESLPQNDLPSVTQETPSQTTQEQLSTSLKETQATETNSSVILSENVSLNTDSKTKKMIRKPGRTLLVKSVSGNAISESTFNSITGLKSKAQTKSSSSFFLTFDTVDSALDAYRKLKESNSDFRVKYSTYRVFFTMNGLTNSTDYNQVKRDLIEHVNKQSGASVLYCKLYRKDNKFIGCGDLTIDTLEGMNMLLNKEGGKKEFSFGSLSGTFYRYNGTQSNSVTNVRKSKTNSSVVNQ